MRICSPGGGLLVIVVILAAIQYHNCPPGNPAVRQPVEQGLEDGGVRAVSCVCLGRRLGVLWRGQHVGDTLAYQVDLMSTATVRVLVLTVAQ